MRNGARGGWLVLLLALTGAASQAAELRFHTSNDQLPLGKSGDDHYTAALGLDLTLGRYVYSLEERLFTDQQAGLRFDETSLTTRRAIFVRRGWQGAVELGVLNVGRGLFGEQGQNALHARIGSGELKLGYVGSGVHAVGRIDVQRPMVATRRLIVSPRFELGAAVGYRYSAVAALKLDWRVARRVRLIALVGGRLESSGFEPLKRHLAGAAPTWRISLRYGSLLTVGLSQNGYGAGQRHAHLTLGGRF